MTSTRVTASGKCLELKTWVVALESSVIATGMGVHQLLTIFSLLQGSWGCFVSGQSQETLDYGLDFRVRIHAGVICCAFSR